MIPKANEKFPMETADILTTQRSWHVEITNEDTLFDTKGIVHLEFITQGHIINRDYSVEILKPLHEVVRRKGHELWSNDWILYHNNAPAHKALSIWQFGTQKSNTEIEHPPILSAVPKK